MNYCDVCGGKSENTFKVNYAGADYQFDCFECAIYELAPSCAHCGLIILSHGVRVKGELFCSGSCARFQGQGVERDFLRMNGSLK